MPTRFQNLLVQKINELVEDRKEGLTGGYLAEKGYQFECGYIHGLRDVIRLCNELNKEIE